MKTKVFMVPLTETRYLELVEGKSIGDEVKGGYRVQEPSARNIGISTSQMFLIEGDTVTYWCKCGKDNSEVREVVVKVTEVEVKDGFLYWKGKVNLFVNRSAQDPIDLNDYT